MSEPDYESAASEMGFSEEIILLAKMLVDAAQIPSYGLVPSWFAWLDDARSIADEFKDWDFDEYAVSINQADHLEGALLIMRVNDMAFVWAQGRSVDGHVEMYSLVVRA